jgi:hypothetical protein
MLLSLKEVQAIFPVDEVLLESAGGASMFWDRHGGTFVVRLEGLTVSSWPGGDLPAGIRLLTDLTPPEAALRELKGFAAAMELALTQAPPGAEVREHPFLVAAHVPSRGLFIFSEDAQLATRGMAPGEVKIVVTGQFRSRRVISQEADIVIHLEPPSVARLLSYLYAWVGGGG